MRFIDFDLYTAIYEVRKDMIADGAETPGERRWENDEESRLELCRRVIQKLHANTDQTIISAWVDYRTRPKANGTDKNKYDLTIEVSKVRGRECFYSMLGSCSDDVHLDRLIAGGEYSLANCVIACGYHNSKRGDKPIEQFLAEETTKLRTSICQDQ